MYIGIDLGGTNIAVGLVGDDGKLLKSVSTPTLSERDYTEIVNDMAKLVRGILSITGHTIDDIDGIGIGNPGTVDNENGIILYSNNLGWENANVREELNKYFDVPVNIENDANAAAFGEYSLYADKIKDFVFVTLGTGVGGGIIIDGKIYRGFNGAGAELGHTTLVHNGVRCTCGKKGCWEAYGSVTALIRQTRDAIAENPGSLMAKIYKDTGVVNGRTAFDAAKAGDEAGKKVVDKYLEYVADGIVSMINIFAPEALMIGGGISKEGDYLLEPIKKFCAENVFCKNIRQTEIKIATLNNDAGIIGAAMACKKSLEG